LCFLYALCVSPSIFNFTPYSERVEVPPTPEKVNWALLPYLHKLNSVFGLDYEDHPLPHGATKRGVQLSVQAMVMEVLSELIARVREMEHPEGDDSTPSKCMCIVIDQVGVITLACVHHSYLPLLSNTNSLFDFSILSPPQAEELSGSDRATI
jgi:hypothetical protein